MEETDPFTETLVKPTDLPESYVTATRRRDIIGVDKFASYYLCHKCSKKLPESSTNGAPVKCTRYKLKQKTAGCSLLCYLQVLLEFGNEQVALTVFDDVIRPAVALVWRDPDRPVPKFTEDIVSDKFLALPTVKVTYNKKKVK